jgi:hypothetical protein
MKQIGRLVYGTLATIGVLLLAGIAGMIVYSIHLNGHLEKAAADGCRETCYRMFAGKTLGSLSHNKMLVCMDMCESVHAEKVL